MLQAWEAALMIKYQWPSNWDGWIRKSLASLGYNLDSPKPLADAVLKASENYQQTSSTV
ncbi:MAG: hypothetical protein HRT44_03720 [Bdellovibrionales bacterium]|nr:hypothetical protein [Bdellovibrionales bacterium]